MVHISILVSADDVNRVEVYILWRKSQKL